MRIDVLKKLWDGFLKLEASQTAVSYTAERLVIEQTLDGAFQLLTGSHEMTLVADFRSAFEKLKSDYAQQVQAVDLEVQIQKVLLAATGDLIRMFQPEDNPAIRMPSAIGRGSTPGVLVRIVYQRDYPITGDIELDRIAADFGAWAGATDGANHPGYATQDFYFFDFADKDSSALLIDRGVLLARSFLCHIRDDVRRTNKRSVAFVGYFEDEESFNEVHNNSFRPDDDSQPIVVQERAIRASAGNWYAAPTYARAPVTPAPTTSHQALESARFPKFQPLTVEVVNSKTVP